jgi:hypothetical protein
MLKSADLRGFVSTNGRLETAADLVYNAFNSLFLIYSLIAMTQCKIYLLAKTVNLLSFVEVSRTSYSEFCCMERN